MKDENDLKRVLEEWSDQDIADKKGHNILDWATSSAYTWGCSEIEDEELSFASQSTCFATKIVARPFLLMTDFGGENTFIARNILLRRFQKLIEKVAPVSAQILNTRKQSLGNGSNRPVLSGIDLKSVFDYLNYRFEEAAFCILPLLNSSYSPLKEAMLGCNMVTNIS